MFPWQPYFHRYIFLILNFSVILKFIILLLFLAFFVDFCLVGTIYFKRKVKCDHRSKFSNLSNWKEEAWKKQGFNGIRIPLKPWFFQASSFVLLKLENLLRRSHFTFIYNCSTNMNYFIYFTQYTLSTRWLKNGFSSDIIKPFFVLWRHLCMSWTSKEICLEALLGGSKGFFVDVVFAKRWKITKKDIQWYRQTICLLGSLLLYYLLKVYMTSYQLPWQHPRSTKRPSKCQFL